MQHIAIVTLAAATSGSLLLLGWLWLMESKGEVPAWIRKMNDAGGRGDDLL